MMTGEEAIEALAKALKFKEEALEGFTPNKDKFEGIRSILQIEIEAIKCGIEALKYDEKRKQLIKLWEGIILNAKLVGSTRVWAYEYILVALKKCEE